MSSAGIKLGNVAIVAIFAAAASLVACSAQPSDTAESTSNLDVTCGNGVRDPGEQCDDANASGLDGCSATCQFEQFQRMNALKLQFATTTFCNANAVGHAIGDQAQGPLQDALDGAVKSGSVSILLGFGDVSDPANTDAASFTIDTLLGKAPTATGYDGNHDADWWYAPDPASIDTNGKPASSIPATIANNTLSAGPGNLTLALSLGDAGAQLHVSGGRMKAKIDALTKPGMASGSAPVGHTANERLDPALKSFASLSNGEMCGNVSAASLANVKIPQQVVDYCGDYTTSNSMLDLFIGGCDVFVFTVINQTQPDKVDAQATAVGAGGPYKLKASSSNKKVNGCTDKSGATVDLQKCLAAAAYSSAFTFTTDRVVVRD